MELVVQGDEDGRCGNGVGKTNRISSELEPERGPIRIQKTPNYLKGVYRMCRDPDREWYSPGLSPTEEGEARLNRVADPTLNKCQFGVTTLVKSKSEEVVVRTFFHSKTTWKCFTTMGCSYDYSYTQHFYVVLSTPSVTTKCDILRIKRVIFHVEPMFYNTPQYWGN